MFDFRELYLAVFGDWGAFIVFCGSLVSLGGAATIVKFDREYTRRKISDHDNKIDSIQLQLTQEIKEIKTENKKDFKHMDGKMDRIMEHLLREKP